MEKITTLEQLAKLSEEHPYYCSEGTFTEDYTDWESFKESQESLDKDLNLIFRWDVYKNDEEGYSLTIHVILQRKGRLSTHHISNLKEENVPSIVSFFRETELYLSKLFSFVEIKN